MKIMHERVSSAINVEVNLKLHHSPKRIHEHGTKSVNPDHLEIR